MIYFLLRSLPRVSDLYRIERKTVWRTMDEQNLLVLIVSGRCVFTVNSVDYTVEAGEAFLIPANQEYQRRPIGEESCEFFYFHFDLETQPEILSAEEARNRLEKRREQRVLEMMSEMPRGGENVQELYLFSPVKMGKEALEWAEQCLNEKVEKNTDSELMVSLLLTRILAQMNRVSLKMLHSESLLPPEKIPYKLKRAMQYIHQNFSQPITLEELCVYCSVSRQHLIRLFHQELHTTPIRYINKLKMAHARDLLQKNPHLSCQEAAFELGFENPHYFSRLFAQLEGVSPSGFKKRLIEYADRDRQKAQEKETN